MQRLISDSQLIFVQDTVLKNHSQFPRRFNSQGVLSEKTRVNFPGEEIALYLSVSLFPISKKLKIHARSTSEVFSRTALLTHFVNEILCPLGFRGIFFEQYLLTFEGAN